MAAFQSEQPVAQGAIAIIGLGLIGGSLALALKSSADPPRIVGWDRDTHNLDLARTRGAIDLAAEDARSAVAGAELVIVAVPALAARQVFTVIASALRSDTIVTDVISTKAAVCDWAAELLPAPFVGGHPMAGSEQSGMAHARADLFTGAIYCLTPLPTTSPTAVETVTALVHAVGAQPLILDPTQHDQAVAAISHLPFMLSTALVEVTTRHPQWDIFKRLAASGYRDISRLASGDPAMHRDICLTNADALRPWLLAAAHTLQQLAADLDNPAALQHHFDHAKTARDALYQREDQAGS